MHARNFLRVALAWAMPVGVQMPGVGAPLIGGVAGAPAGLEPRCERPKDRVFAATKDVGQDLACVVIDSLPQPA
jgi:hypothetical protein